MRKLVALLALLALSATVAAEPTGLEEVRSFDSPVKEVHRSGGETAVSTRRSIHLLDSEGWKREPGARLGGSDLLEGFAAAGTRLGGSSLYVWNLEGERVLRRGLGWLGDVELYRDGDHFWALGSPGSTVSGFRLDGEKRFMVGGRDVRRALSDSSEDVDGDGTGEFLVSAGGVRRGSGELRLYDLGGELEWKLEQLPGRQRPVRGVFGDGTVLAVSPRRLTLRDADDGSELWTRGLGGELPETARSGGRFLLSNSSGTFSVSREGGIDRLSRLHCSLLEVLDSGRAVCRTGAEARLLSSSGETLKRAEVPQGSDVHVAGDRIYASVGKKLYRMKLGGEPVDPPEDAVIVGKGRKLLKAVSLNLTVMAAESYDPSLVPDERPVYTVGIDGPNRTSRVKAEGEEVYVEDREKRVLAAALLSRRNASLSFDPASADRSLEDEKAGDLRDRLVEELKPNHVVVADLKTSSGALASYIAARSGAVPVDAGEAGPEELSGRIAGTFRQIGENRNTVFHGKHVSLIDTPAFTSPDPVDRGLLGDPADGDTLESDLRYGDLDGDRRLEAGVGRYPEDLLVASRLYLSSFREEGDTALLASSYLYDSWPAVLATAGGGMFTGNAAEEVLEKQGYDVRHLVEHRAKPAEFLVDLAGGPAWLLKVREKNLRLEKLVEEGATKLGENAVLVVKGLKHAEHALRIMLEYRWEEFVLEGVDWPEDPELEEVRDLLDSLLPDRRTLLEPERLEEELEHADVFLYSGEGRESWNLPEGKFGPDQFPELNRTLMLDLSDGSGTSAMGGSAMKSGAAAYAGLQGVSYHSYARSLALDFLQHGKTAGESLRLAVNGLRSRSLVYSPESLPKTGVKRKMERSLRLYGNPETVKDPVTPEGVNVSKSCTGGKCTIELSVEPSPETVENVPTFSGAEPLRKAFRPILPVYVHTQSLPDGAEVLESEVSESFDSREDLELPIYRPPKLMGSDPELPGEYPSTSHRLREDGSLEYVQAAAVPSQGGLSVLQRAEARVEYRAPLTVELERQGRWLFAKVYSDRRRSLEIYLDAGEERLKERIEVEGQQRFNLTWLESGRTEARVEVHGEKLSATHSRRFTLEEPLDILIQAGELQAGAAGEIRMVASNPNPAAVERMVRLEVDGPALVSPRQRRNRSLELPPGSSDELEWEAVGLEEGDLSVKVAGEEKYLTVKRASRSNHLHGLTSIVDYSSGASVRSREKSDGAVATVSSDSWELSVRRNHSGRVAWLETPEMRLELWRDPGGEVWRFDSAEGGILSSATQERVRGDSGSGTAESLKPVLADRASRLEEELLEVHSSSE